MRIQEEVLPAHQRSPPRPLIDNTVDILPQGAREARSADKQALKSVRRALKSVRSFMRLVMSISLNVVSIAYVFCAPLSRSATRARSRVIFTRLPARRPGCPSSEARARRSDPAPHWLGGERTSLASAPAAALQGTQRAVHRAHADACTSLLSRGFSRGGWRAPSLECVLLRHTMDAKKPIHDSSSATESSLQTCSQRSRHIGRMQCRTAPAGVLCRCRQLGPQAPASKAWY